MTQPIDSLLTIAKGYDAIVFDQWGVLHNGQTAYPHAVECLNRLQRQGTMMAVLSNSGKRAAPNAGRIASMGFEPGHFDVVMSSGEALWQEIQQGLVPKHRFFPIERSPGDAAIWAEGLDLPLSDTLSDAEAILLMGLPDGSAFAQWEAMLDEALSRSLPMYCTNPDKASPRGDSYVISPGVLAASFEDRGGKVRFYGKPHRPIFDALSVRLGAGRVLMVGDSLEHDIAGAQTIGWDSLLIQGGLYAQEFASGAAADVLAALLHQKGVRAPTYRMELLA